MLEDASSIPKIETWMQRIAVRDGSGCFFGSSGRQVWRLAGAEFELQQPQCDEDLCHRADAGADCGGIPRDQPLGRDRNFSSMFEGVIRCDHYLTILNDWITVS